MIVKLFIFLVSFACLVISSNFLFAKEFNIVFPLPLLQDDNTEKYVKELLELSMNKSGVKYHLSYAKDVIVQDRLLKMLEQEQEINLMWTMTSKEREKELLPIRIPLFKGLIGWRVFLIKKENIEKFSKINKIEELRKLSAGQGFDWPDLKILKNGGFNVTPWPNHRTLLRSLSAGRFDYFPRGVMEIQSEFENNKELGLAIESNLVIKYPAAAYFFTNKKNADLAKAIENGLYKAIKDKSFDKLFYKYYKDVISNLKLKDRIIFEIDNVLLPLETPLNQKELWFSK